MPFFNLKQGAI